MQYSSCAARILQPCSHQQSLARVETETLKTCGGEEHQCTQAQRLLQQGGRHAMPTEENRAVVGGEDDITLWWRTRRVVAGGSVGAAVHQVHDDNIGGDEILGWPWTRACVPM